MAENMILCSFLGICSCYDCKKRTIPGWLLYTGILLGLIYAAMLLILGQYSWSAILTGVLPGTFMLLLCHITEGKLGSADGMMVIPIVAEVYRRSDWSMSAYLFSGSSIDNKQKRQPEYADPFCTISLYSRGFGVDN